MCIKNCGIHYVSNSNLKFVNSIDLRKLHVIVKQGLGDDVQDTLPLCTREKATKQVRSKLDIAKVSLEECG